MLRAGCGERQPYLHVRADHGTSPVESPTRVFSQQADMAPPADYNRRPRTAEFCHQAAFLPPVTCPARATQQDASQQVNPVLLRKAERRATRQCQQQPAHSQQQLHIVSNVCTNRPLKSILKKPTHVQHNIYYGCEEDRYPPHHQVPLRRKDGKTRLKTKRVSINEGRNRSRMYERDWEMNPGHLEFPEASTFDSPV